MSYGTSPQPAGTGHRAELTIGVRAAVPLSVAVLGFAVSFGIVARSAGMGWWPTVIMSATTFGGAAQFAAASVVDAGGGVAAAIVTAVLLNSRYLPMGISMAPALTGGPLRRFFSALLIADESWAVAHLGGGRFSPGRLIGSGLLLWLVWTVGTGLGMFGAELLSDPNRLGLDMAAPALFLALLVGQLRNRRAAAAALLGAVIALALTPVAPPGVPLVMAVTAGLVGLREDGR